MLANRVREYTTTVGTGDITLAGPMAGFVRFADTFSVGDRVIYVLEDGDNYEIGTGTLTAESTLARTDVQETLMDGTLVKGAEAAAISLSGQARLYCAATAEFLTRDEYTGQIKFTWNDAVIGGTDLSNSTVLLGTAAEGLGLSANEISVSGSDLFVGSLDADTVIRQGAAELGRFSESGLALSDGASLRLGNAASLSVSEDDIVLSSSVNSGQIKLTANDASGITNSLLEGNPDGATSIFYGGLRAASTIADGFEIIDRDGNSPILAMRDSDGTLNGRLISDVSSMRMLNSVNGGEVALQATNAAGIVRNTFVANPDGISQVFHAGKPALTTDTLGVALRASDSGSPRVSLQDSAGATRAFLQARSDSFRLDSQINGAPIILQGRNVSGTNRAMFSVDPDGAAILYHAGDLAFETISNGARVRTTAIGDTLLRLASSNGTDRGFVVASDNNITLRSLNHGGNVLMQGEDAGGILRTIFTGDPDGAGTTYFNGQNALSTQAEGILVRSTIGTTGQVRLRGNDGVDNAILNAGSTGISLRSLRNGASISLTGNNVSGDNRSILHGAPDDATRIYHAGLQALTTHTNGINVFDQDGDTLSPSITWRTAASISQGFIQFSPADGARIRSQINSANLLLQGTNNTGTVVSLAAFDPDGVVTLYRQGVRTAATQAHGLNVYSAEGNISQIQFFSNTNQLTGFINAATGGLSITSAVAGQNILLRARNNSSSSTTVFEGDPSGESALYHIGQKAIFTSAVGMNVRSTTGTAPIINLETSSGSLSGAVVSDTSSIRLLNRLASSPVELQGTDSNNVVRNTFLANPDSSANLFHAGNVAVTTLTGGVQIRHSIGNTPVIQLADNGGIARATLQSEGNGALRLTNTINGAIINLRGADSGGVLRGILTGDPDSAALLYYAGEVALETTPDGFRIRDPRLGPTNAPVLRFENDAGLTRSFIQAQDNGVFAFINQQVGAAVTIQATDAGNIRRAILFGDPDGPTQLYHAGQQTLATNVSGVTVAATGSGAPRIALQDRATIEAQATDLVMRNAINGGHIVLLADNNSGVPKEVFTGDPDGSAALYFNGISAFNTTIDGVIVRDSVGTLKAPIFRLENPEGTGTGFFIQQQTDGLVRMTNQNVSDSIVIGGTNSSGTQVNMVSLNPDGAAQLFYEGVRAVSTNLNGIDVFDTTASTPILRMLRSDGGLNSRFISDGISLRFINDREGVPIQLQATSIDGNIRPLFSGDPDGAVIVYHADAPILSTTSAGISLRSAAPILNLQTPLGATQSFIRHLTATLQISNQVDGGPIELSGRDVGGNSRLLVTADPDGSTNLYTAGQRAFITDVMGGIFRAATGISSARTLYQLSDGSTRGLIEAFATDFVFRNPVNGGDVYLQADATSGTTTTLLHGDPDGATTLYYAGSSMISTDVSGVSVNGNIKVSGTISSEYGTTRPTPASLNPGSRFFDTNLNKPIYVNADQDGWVDALGAAA